jgi:mono/diheme cytochrome c family protein
MTVLIPAASIQAQDGKPVYDKWCSGCHGDTGAGDGYGSKTMLPHPRDFTKGVYKIRTTASGEIPTDADLRHVIEVGMPGTAMPEWKSRLSDGEIVAVVKYIKTFSPNSFTQPAKTIAIGKAPSGSGVDEGKAAFQKLECSKCHGMAGRADGKSAPTLKDDYGNPIRPADLTENWKFRGGNTVTEIYTRLRTGLDGTPMPSFQDAIDNKLITDEQLWRVAQYVHSLSPEKPPEPREVVRAARAQTLPTTLDAPAWNGVEKFWVPLVGQIIAKPRWFAPTVDGLWVQALHDGRTLALRVSWDDPSKSPDPTWDQWLGRMSQTLTDVDGPLATQQGPDRLVVHFAKNPNDESKKPYFLGGDAKSPVYAWRWTSEPKIEEGTEAGLGKFTASLRRWAVAGAVHAAPRVQRYDAGTELQPWPRDPDGVLRRRWLERGGRSAGRGEYMVRGLSRCPNADAGVRRPDRDARALGGVGDVVGHAGPAPRARG